MPKNSKRFASIATVAVATFALVGLSSTASVAAAPDVFSVTTLTTDNPVFVDSDPDTGDDDGFVGVTGTKFITSGDDATVAYDLADMGNAYFTDVSALQTNWLFSDFKTQTSYVFEFTEVAALTYDVTGFQALDQTGDLTGVITPLSTTVPIDNSVDDCTIFASGYGRVAIWDGCLGVIYDIALPAGDVTTVTGVATFVDYDATRAVLTNYYEVDNDVSQGAVVEFDGSALHIVAVAYDDLGNSPEGIFRYDVQAPAAVPTEVLSFNGEGPDMYEFTLSPATGQWCSHVEGGWSAISGVFESELAFCASATFSVAAAAAPGLAATGVDIYAPVAIGGLVLLAGLGLMFAGRRRAA